jgi:hypothetical protein
MSEEDDEFLRQLKILEELLAQEPQPEQLMEYRLYYDTPTGNPFCFAMEHHHGSAYIVVSKEDYERNALNEIKVINGKLCYKEIDAFNKIKYVPSQHGVSTLKNDIQFPVDEDYAGETSTWNTNG